MLIIDNINELNLCCRMLEVLREKRTYTVPQISSLLGLSMYSGHLYKMPLFNKLINEGVFKVFSNSKPVIYEFSPEKLAKSIETSDIFIKFLVAEFLRHKNRPCV